MNTKYLGSFNLQYPISRCEVQLTLNQNLQLQSDECIFEEKKSESGKCEIYIKPTILRSYIQTLDGEQVFKLFTQIIEIYHFYQEIWSFLLNYKYVTLKITVVDITKDFYIVQYQVYLCETVFQQQDEVKLTLPQIKRLSNDEQIIYREQMKKMIVHQYAKESFIILFELLNLKTTIVAYIRPKHQSKMLDNLIYQSYKQLDYYQQKYLARNLQIPNIQSQKRVSKQSLEQLQMKLLDEHDQLMVIEKNQNEQQNVFNVNEEQQMNFTYCSKPINLKNELLPYQAQAVQWMLYREGKIDASTLNVQDEKVQLNKMWSEVQLSENNYIYFNEFTGQFSNQIVLSKDFRGGILADQMGLGKTICSIALILLNKEMKEEINEGQTVKKVKTEIKKANTLLIVQLSIFEHWKKEIEKHSIPNKLEVYDCYSLDQRRRNTQLEVYDIVITTYGILSSEYKSEGILFQYDWERIILDEAHTIKSKSAVCAQAASSLNAQCRWCLTGTPIQNNLDDLFSLFHFLKVETFSNYTWFNKYINKQEDPNQKFELLHQIIKPILLRRTKKTENVIQALHLPNKQHLFIKVKMSIYEEQFYDLLYRKTTRILSEYFGFGNQLKKKVNYYIHAFQILSALRQCCDHAGLIANKFKLKMTNAIQTQQEIAKNKSEFLIKDFINNSAKKLEQQLRQRIKDLQQQVQTQQNDEENDDETESNDETQDSNDEQNPIEGSQQSEQIERELIYKIQELEKITEEKQKPETVEKKYTGLYEKVRTETCVICFDQLIKQQKLYYLSCGHIYCAKCLDEYIEKNSTQSQAETTTCPICRKQIDKQDQLPLFNNLDQKKLPKQKKETNNDSEYASLQESTKINQILKYVEYVQGLGEKVVIFTQWIKVLNFIEGKLRIKGISFRKITGSMNKKQREGAITDFFKQDITAMMISLKAGAYGINLCCANHVILVDPWWNPAVEDQAVERVHRLGQNKEVKILSFICENTIEERVIQLHAIKRKLFNDALHLKLPEQEFTFQDQLEFLLKQ